MAAYGITLVRQDDNGTVTASSWALSGKDHYEALVDRVTANLGPADETVMVDENGQRTIADAVDKNSMRF